MSSRWLGHEDGVNIHTQCLSVCRTEGMIGVEECGRASGLVYLCELVQGEAGLAGGFRTEKPSTGAEGYIGRQHMSFQ